MIDQLRTARGAYFYRIKARFTKSAVRDLFVELRKDAVNPSQTIFRAEREPLGDARYSAISFAYDRPVAFLEGAPDKTDRVYGFLLLVEKDQMASVFKSGLDLTAAFKKVHLDPIGRARVERAIARHDAVFERLSLRNMTTSRLALRSKTLESRDLENAIATSSAGRFIPQGYRVRRADGSYSATPSTGRIALRSDRANYEDAVAWASQIIDLLLDDYGATSPFIRNFARPIELSQIGDGVHATHFAVDTIALSDAIYEAEEPIRLVREVAGAWQLLGKAQTDAVLADLDQSFELEFVEGEYLMRDAAGHETGALKLRKARIALRRLNRATINDVFVENTDIAVGEDPGRRPLVRHIDAEDMFAVLFSDRALAYIDGSLFRDEALVGGGALFLRHLHPNELLQAATSEKGEFVEGQAAFSDGSVFRLVVDSVAQDEVLICDDLGDEWADFIGVAPGGGGPAMVSFYHAKHGDPSLSASAFHDAVGQAIKNLGRLSLTGDTMAAKYASWENPYQNGGVLTAINRYVRGGTREQVEEAIVAVSTAPDVVRRVFIVTSSLSRGEVEAAFGVAAAGHALRPNFVQLYWLLMGFFSACVEIGAVGYVVCRP